MIRDRWLPSVRRTVSARRRGILETLVAAVILGVASMPLVPPAPAPESAAPEAFSAVRAQRHVEAIAVEPHPMGSEANARVREYIVDSLGDLGLAAELQPADVPDYYLGSGGTVELVNVFATIAGADPSGRVIFVAHYDSEPATPGANDNAVAVATLLESGRALLAGPPLRNDVVLLFTDGEEPAPRYGATAFVAAHPEVADSTLVVNFEAVGGSGPSHLIETAGSGWVVQQYAASADRPVAFSFLTTLVDLMGGADTDFAPFKDAGAIGLSFAYLHDSPIYHTAADAPEAVSPASLQHHGDHAMAASRRFGDLDLEAPHGDGDRVYFTVGRWTLVHYSATWSLPLAMAAVGLALLWLRRAHGTARLRLFRGTASAVAALLVVVIVAILLWAGMTELRDMPGVFEAYVYLAVILGGGWVATVAVRRRLRRRVDERSFSGGNVILWMLLAVGAGWWLPGASPLFVWPLLGAAAAALVTLGTPRTPTHRAIRRLLTALPVAILMVPAVDLFFQLAQPRPGNTDSELTPVVGVAVLLFLLAAHLVAAMGRLVPPPEPNQG